MSARPPRPAVVPGASPPPAAPRPASPGRPRTAEPVPLAATPVPEPAASIPISGSVVLGGFDFPPEPRPEPAASAARPAARPVASPPPAPAAPAIARAAPPPAGAAARATGLFADTLELARWLLDRFDRDERELARALSRGAIALLDHVALAVRAPRPPRPGEGLELILTLRARLVLAESLGAMTGAQLLHAAGALERIADALASARPPPARPARHPR